MDKEFAEAFKEEIEKEASTYTDKARDEKEKKKRHFAFGGKKKSRHGESGYGKGEEMDREFTEAFGLEERKMTDGEKEEREEIVKKLKPKLQSFKDKYGDDAKKVMYATATKQAMEEVEINEVKFEAGKVYHQDFGGGEISYFRADSVLKNNRWKGMTVDEIGGRQQRPKNITADEKVLGWKLTPKNEIPKGLKEEVELDEAFSMGKGEKRVVDAFYDQKTIKAHGASILTTDGKTLTKRGMGGQDIAKWVNGKIKIVAVSDVKSTELILKYMKKSIPSGVFEEVEVDGRTRGYRTALTRINTRRERVEARKGSVREVSPPDWEGTVKKMKKDKNIDNPWALAWYMKNKGYTPHATEQEWIQNSGSESFKIWAKHFIPEAYEDGTDEYKKHVKKMTPGQEEVEIDEKWAVGVVYHQDFGSGEISYFRADSLLKNRRWKGMAVDEYGGKQKKPRNITADEKTAGWEITPKNKIPKGLKEEVELDEAAVLDVKDVDKWSKEIEKGIGAGWVSVQSSNLGGDKNVAIMIKFTLEAEKDWPNNILQNARFAMIRIATDGTMEMFASHRNLKNMRKTKIKSAKDVVQNINTWIKKVDEGRIEIQPFSTYITEGRPRIEDPDAARAGDEEKARLVASQQKKYKPEEVAGIARKHKVRMDGEPIPGNGDWLIAVRGGITLDYDYRNNETTIKGWKVDRKKIRAHINKYEQGGSTYEDLQSLSDRRALGVRGFESAFELIGEQLELDEAKEFWAVIDKAKGGEVMAISSDEKGAKSSVKMSNFSKHDYHFGKDPRTLKIVKVAGSYKQGEKMIGTKLSFKEEFELDEEAPANSVAGGNVNLDPFTKKKRKNAKVQWEMFGGQKVFVVSPERFYDSRMGKARYVRYEKYVGNDKLGETIRQYGRNNPKNAIILKNSGNGAMLYLKYGRQ